MTARDAAICRWTIYLGVVLFGLLLLVSFRAVVPLAALIAVVLLSFGPRRRLLRTLRDDRIVQALAALLLVAAALAYWSADYGQTLPKLVQLSAIFGVGSALVVLIRRCADVVSVRGLDRAVAAAVGLCSVGVLIVGFFPEGLQSLGVDPNYFGGTSYLANRALTLLPFLAFVALLYPSARAPCAAGAIALCVVVVATLAFPVPLMGAAAACSALLLYCVFRLLRVGRPAPVFVGAFAAALFVVSVALMIAARPLLSDVASGDAAAPSALRELIAETNLSHRMEIWMISAERALERPLTGWGLDATRRVPNQDGSDAISLHPHNAFLQAWLELGVFGAVACAALFWLIGRRLSAVFGADPHQSALSGAAFGGLLLVFGAGFGAFQSWWLTSLILLAAFAALRVRAAERESG